jgi:hypothetical protein
MKSEERHRLEANWLATNMPVWADKLRPYSSAILFAVAAVLGLYAALTFWNSRTAARERDAWNQFQHALFNQDLELSEVRRLASSEDMAGTRMQDWAYVAWADRQILLASQNYLVDREATLEGLPQVESIYKLYSDKAIDAEVKNRARFGLARLYELQGKFDEARGAYKTVQGSLGPMAATRLKDLETNGEQIAEAATWLATATLPKRTLPAGQGATGDLPAFDAPLPSSTESAPVNPGEMFNFDDILGEDFGGAGTTRYGDAAAPAEGAATDGAAAEDAPTEGAPAGTETPATDAPTAGDTPAADAEQPATATDTTEATPADGAAANADDAAEPAAAGAAGQP